MEFFYLIPIVLGLSGQNLFKKMFSGKSGGQGIYTFALLTAFSAMLFFLVTAPRLQWEVRLLPYAFFFAVTYGAATIFSTLAISCGPLSLSALISSFSLMIPTFYGLLFLKEPLSFGLLPGICLLACSLFLINKRTPDTRVTLKWLFFVLLSFAGNGLCSVAQKMQQIAFGGSFKHEFMLLSLTMVAGILLIAIVLSERKVCVKAAATGWYFALGCGIMNGAVNLFVMILSGLMSVSLMFPLMSVGSILVTFVLSKILYKETLTKTQYLGFLLGIAAIILLNL